MADYSRERGKDPVRGWAHSIEEVGGLCLSGNSTSEVYWERGSSTPERGWAVHREMFLSTVQNYCNFCCIPVNLTCTSSRLMTEGGCKINCQSAMRYVQKW